MHTRSLFSTTQTLRHLFLAPLQTSRIAFFPSTRIQNRLPLKPLPQPRYYASSQSDDSRFPQDEEIAAEFVQMVNTEGKLDPPITLRRALQSVERPNYFLQQVSPGRYDQRPICRIVSRMAVKEYEKTRAKAAHAARTSLKQVELNWAIDGHDLAHRLKQLTNFLGKGRRVEIILTRKKGKRAPNVDEVKHLMDSVLGTVRAADAVQVKPMEGEPGRHVTLVVKKKDN